MNKDIKIQEPMDVDEADGSALPGCGTDNWETIEKPVESEVPSQHLACQTVPQEENLPKAFQRTLIDVSPQPLPRRTSFTAEAPQPASTTEAFIIPRLHNPFNDGSITIVATDYADKINAFVSTLSTEEVVKFNHVFKKKATYLFPYSTPAPNDKQVSRKEFNSISSQTDLHAAVMSLNFTVDPDLISNFVSKKGHLEGYKDDEGIHLNQTKLQPAIENSPNKPVTDGNSQTRKNHSQDYSKRNRHERDDLSTTIISTEDYKKQQMPQNKSFENSSLNNSLSKSYSPRGLKENIHRSYSNAVRNEENNSLVREEAKRVSTTISILAPPVHAQVANVTSNKTEWVRNMGANRNSLQQTFSRSDKKSLNILVLGQTGVGKSTWINAFANYLMYETMDEAIEAEAPICVIPTKFQLFDESYQRREIVFGGHDNEVFSDQGQSATQNARTYLLEHEEYDIYIIDTPGIGDTRGAEQDSANLKKILRAVSPFKELHAICFLFKANDARLTTTFKYCIRRLLGNLSKSALNNACFVFTNARGTFYKPGDTMGPLKAYFKELLEKDNVSVPLEEGNTFCLDNEAFRFICAYFSGINFSAEERESFADSWKYSSQEIARFVEHAARRRPHNTADTLSVNETRTWILQLVEPTIGITNMIQSNIEAQKNQIHELRSIENNIDELQKKADIPIISVKVKHLEKPQTVCTQCVRYEEIAGVRQPIYVTVCHNDCSLANLNPECVPDPALKNCVAFPYGEKCRNCRCHWKVHKRITYEQHTEIDYVSNQALQTALAQTEDVSKIKKQMIRSSKKLIGDYEGELGFILTAMAKFSIFLTRNGISQQSDIFEKHMENLILAEENLLRSVENCDDKKYRRFIELLRFYQERRQKVLETSYDEISLVEINDIKQKLFTLPLTGTKISELFDLHVDADEQNYATNITRCDKTSLMQKAFAWFKNTGNSAFNAAKSLLY